MLLILTSYISSRKVARIIRRSYAVKFNYRDDDFKSYVDEEFSKFESFLDKYKDDRIKCVDKYLPALKNARNKCLGTDFEIFNRGFDLLEFKMNAILHHLLDLAFNENCMDIGVNHRICVTMLEDIKLLILNKYNVLPTLQKNMLKYITITFTKSKFVRMTKLIDYLLIGYKKQTDELPNKRMVIKGLVWGALVRNHNNSDDPDMNIDEQEDEHASLLEEEGGPDKYYIAKIKSHIKNKYSYLEGEYKNFIEQNNIESPYKNDLDSDYTDSVQNNNDENIDEDNNDPDKPVETDGEKAKKLVIKNNSGDEERFRRNLVNLLDHRGKPNSVKSYTGH